MAASREDIDSWIKQAKEWGNKYILSACDTWDHEDYPIYCDNLSELREAIKKYDGKNMQKINEVIEINGDEVTEDLSPELFKRRT